MNSTLTALFNSFDTTLISPKRKLELEPIKTYLKTKRENKESINLVFICTHNSRRSQFAQFWGHVAAAIYNVPILSFSAGTEITEANPRTIQTLRNLGVHFKKEGNKNPQFIINLGTELKLFSKDIYHPSLPSNNFAAIMTCSDADKNCPFISNCEKRFPMKFEDPKSFDNTEFEVQKYLEKAIEIGTEIKYLFSSLVK